MLDKQQTIKVAQYIAVTFALGLGARGAIYVADKLSAINYTEALKKAVKQDGK